MEVILLGIYAFFVWLIFIKFKLLPWTTPWKVAVAIFPVVVLATTMLLLNIFAPTTTDVRVVKYVVPIVSQVKGRVIEVPVENNRPVKKGDVLFRIDPTPYEIEVRSLEAQLVSDEAKVGGRTGPAQRGADAPARRGVGRTPARRTTQPGDEPGRRRCRPRSNWRRSAWRRTRSSPPPAPAIASIWSRRRPTPTSSPRRSPRRARPSNR